MLQTYFNYTVHVAQSRRERMAFVRAWWRIYQEDRRWTPPFYPTLVRLAVRGDDPHWLRLQPSPLHVEGMPRRKPIYGRAGLPPTEWSAALETPVAASLIWRDRRADQQTAFLGLWRTVNDDEARKRLLEAVLESGWRAGVRRLVGPVHLSPYLGYGFLVDHWDHVPPAGTPYCPPYQAELAGRQMGVIAEDRLWHLPVPAAGAPPGLTVEAAAPALLTEALWPLWSAAPPVQPLLPALDREEARFLLHWWGHLDLQVRVALVNGRPAGFSLLAPDLGPSLRASKGGRTWSGRLRWFLLRRRPMRRGRLLALATDSDTGTSGVANPPVADAVADPSDVAEALVADMRRTARERGWQSIVAGPLPDTHQTARLLAKHGATPVQTVQLFALERG
jgi:hypothetical protein